MSLFTRKQYKFLDRLFFDCQSLQQAVEELRSAAVVSAEQSADPTARQAVEIVAPVPEAMGYKCPEQWLQVVAQTWATYHDGTMIGKLMRRRYILRQSPETITVVEHVSDGVHWYCRREFLNKAGLFAAYKGLKI